MNLSIIESNANHVLFSQSSVLVTIWHGIQEPVVCRRIYQLSRELARTCGTGKVAGLSVIMQSAGAPSPAARDALALLHEDPEQVIHRSALVFAKSGFVASIIRSVVLSLRQRAARRDGHGVFASPLEALDWIVQGLPTPSDDPIDETAILSEIERYSAQKSMVA